MVCFVFIALYGYYWPRPSNAKSLYTTKTLGGPAEPWSAAGSH
jgi:hypothetical protein